MEEKIIELFKRFEVPSENLNDGLRNMAIEKHNYEYLAQEIVKLFAIPDVSNRRELLIVFCDWLKKKNDNKQLWRKTSQLVDWFIKNNL